MLRSIIVLGLSVICVFAATLSYAVEEEDILVYYSFDRLSGKKVLDDSGNGNEAELVGKGSLVDGAFKKGVRLNGGVVEMAANDFIGSDRRKRRKSQWKRGFTLMHTARTMGLSQFEAACRRMLRVPDYGQPEFQSVLGCRASC